MTARVWSATCAAIALGTTMTVLAQDPSPQTSQSQSMSAKTVTVTGCVQRTEQAPTGTSGTRDTASSATKFVLTNAAIKESGTAGTSATAAPPATAIGSEYRLDADEAKLSPHVSHKVEIVGTVEQPSRTEQKPPASAANAPTLKVTDVKMVSATCS